MSTQAVASNDVALQYVNAVREAWGWESLDKLPKATPMSGCSCVLGRAWSAQLGYFDDDDVPENNPEGYVRRCSLRFETEKQTALAAEALGLDANGASRLILPADHPLLKWMWEFDHYRISELVAGRRMDAIRPIGSDGIDPHA